MTGKIKRKFKKRVAIAKSKFTKEAAKKAASLTAEEKAQLNKLKKKLPKVNKETFRRFGSKVDFNRLIN